MFVHIHTCLHVCVRVHVNVCVRARAPISQILTTNLAPEKHAKHFTHHQSEEHKNAVHISLRASKRRRRAHIVVARVVVACVVALVLSSLRLSHVSSHSHPAL